MPPMRHIDIRIVLNGSETAKMMELLVQDLAFNPHIYSTQLLIKGQPVGMEYTEERVRRARARTQGSPWNR